MSSEYSDNKPSSDNGVAISSPEVAIQKPRRLELKTEKYAKIFAFYKKHGHFPNNRSEDVEERSLGQFLTNQKTARSNGKTGEWENERLAELAELQKNCTVLKRSRIPFMKKILEYCQTYKTTPPQASEDSTVKAMGRKLNQLKKERAQFNAEEEALMVQIMEFRSPHLKSRLEKLMDVLDFCKANGRSPKQHTLHDRNEKRMADFLSSTKTYMAENKLTVAEQTVWDEIEKYRRPSQLERGNELLQFVTIHKRAPKVKKLKEGEQATLALTPEEVEENRLATFMTKLKSMHKDGTLEASLVEILKKVFDICHIRSRTEKISEVYDFVSLNGRTPSMNGQDSELRLAVFYNNVRQMAKKGKLKENEIKLLDSIAALITKA